MTILKLHQTPDPILRTKSVLVDKFDQALKDLVDNMFETMYAESGAGLAAIQVGVAQRIFVVDVSEDRSGAMVFINPEITYFSDELIALNEGCLSFPGGRVMIDRPQMVRVSFQDINGTRKEIEADDWLARAVQHELDHLNGILLIDRVSKLKSEMLIKKVKKLQQLH
jgi:peptide deformylase